MTTSSERNETALTPEQAVRLAVLRMVYDPGRAAKRIESDVTWLTGLVLGSGSSPPEGTPRTE